MSSTGSDQQNTSFSKVDPSTSETKSNEPVVADEGSAVGGGEDVEKANIEPAGGPDKQNTASDAQDQGVIGREETIAETKIEPLLEEKASSG